MSGEAISKGDRVGFIGTVRDRLVDGLPVNHIRPIVADGAPPVIDYAIDLSDRVAAFTAALEALTGKVEDATDRDALIRRVVSERNVRRAVVSRDPECDGVTELLHTLDVEVVALGDVEAAAHADIGITGAAYAIALTGSIIIDSRRSGARSASLLPPTHLALVRRDAILPNAGDLLRHLPDRFPEGLPSNMVFITGPSKSADIELILTVGVHGPKELVVGLMSSVATARG
jgi:L-lactate dehydrogenase complex protein LldG